MVIIPIELICMADMKQGYWFLQRQFIWIISLFSFYIGWCWDAAAIYLKPKIKL
jgi:hypothetical protein